jgi:hypothetical protein
MGARIFAVKKKKERRKEKGGEEKKAHPACPRPAP